MLKLSKNWDGPCWNLVGRAVQDAGRVSCTAARSVIGSCDRSVQGK